MRISDWSSDVCSSDLLARRTVRDRVGAGFLSDFNQPLRNKRARDRGAEQIVALIARIGAHNREDEVADDFLAQIVDIDMIGLDTNQLGLGARGHELLALAQAGGEWTDLPAPGDPPAPQ